MKYFFDRGRNRSEEFFRGVLRSFSGWSTDEFNPFFDVEEGVEVFSSFSGNWVGAPKAEYDESRDRMLLYFRERHPGRRGFRMRIGVYDGGFEELVSVGRKELGALSFEGAELIEDDGSYTLFLNYHPVGEGLRFRENWKIRKYSFDSFREFDPSEGRDMSLETDLSHVKDPDIVEGDLVTWSNSKNFTESRTERFDPETGEKKGEIKYESFQDQNPRTTSFLNMKETLVFFDRRPRIYLSGEERSNIGILRDGRIEPVHGPEKSLKSPEGTGSLRYVEAEKVGDEVYFFYEMSAGIGHKLICNRVAKEKVSRELDKII